MSKELHSTFIHSLCCRRESFDICLLSSVLFPDAVMCVGYFPCVEVAQEKYLSGFIFLLEFMLLFYCFSF